MLEIFKLNVTILRITVQHFFCSPCLLIIYTSSFKGQVTGKNDIVQMCVQCNAI